MGSLFKTQAQTVSVAPTVPSTIIDEVNGVTQVPTVNADGSITYTTKALPLTAEQQATKDQLNQIMMDSLAEIQKLSAADYTPDAETQKVLDQWSSLQSSTLDDSYRNRATQEETTLAQRGLSDSSSAQEVRRQRLLDQQKSSQSLALAKDEMAQSIKETQLEAQQNLYNIASTATTTAAAQTAAAAARAQSAAAATNAQRQASLLDTYGSSSGNLFSSAFTSTLGSTLGKTLGTVTQGAGSLLGSWLL